MKLNLFKSGTVLILSVILGLTGCKKDDDNEGGDYPDAVNNSVNLVKTEKFGAILTAKDGKTLYFFSFDPDSTSNCNGQCAIAWPAFYDAKLTVDKGLNIAAFGTITRADGSKQNTYKGWPLYTFFKDVKAGEINGDGAEKIWFVAKPDYSVMLVNKQLTGADGIEYTSNYEPGKEVVQYITDDRGKTLYHSIKDKALTNNFTKPDLSNNSIWPMYEVEAVKNVPSILNKAAFATIVFAGKTQLTYKGFPLYKFGADADKRGNNKGVSAGPGAFPVNTIETVAAPAP